MKSHRKWWKVFDLTEYTKWIYGKLFVGHQYLGFFCILLAITMILAVLFAIVWFKGVDKYNEEHSRPNELNKVGRVGIYFGESEHIKAVGNKVEGFDSGIIIDKSKDIVVDKNDLKK
jgi:hypothetical protein